MMEYKSVILEKKPFSVGNTWKKNSVNLHSIITIGIFWTLRKIKVSERNVRKRNFSKELSSTMFELLILTLMEKVKPVVT